ncbi:MAG: hypothetical protein NTW86_20870 [Candidatus Sumerlaeota bacterium]|nr:hypothetical protein [Candidatus Sumerlaeota bacterium]
MRRNEGVCSGRGTTGRHSGKDPTAKERRGTARGKRSRILALGALALAVASPLAAANPQSVSNPPVFKAMPDVIIGDADLNDGLAVDLNFFTYVNGLNLSKFISDPDTALVNLRAAFKEYPVDQASDVEINGKLQLLSVAGEFSGDPSTWPAEKEISNGGAAWFLSFRDLIRSPHRVSPPVPDPTPTGPPFYEYDNPRRPDGSAPCDLRCGDGAGGHEFLLRGEAGSARFAETPGKPPWTTEHTGNTERRPGIHARRLGGAPPGLVLAPVCSV